MTVGEISKAEETGHSMVRANVPVTLTDYWIPIRCDAYDDGTVYSLTAAKDCDGIVVLAAWDRNEDGTYRVRVVCTEDAELVVHRRLAPDEDGEDVDVPDMPPVAALT